MNFVTPIPFQLLVIYNIIFLHLPIHYFIIMFQAQNFLAINKNNKNLHYFQIINGEFFLCNEGKEDVNDERRQRAIAQLLNEMERIRNIDNDDNEAVVETNNLIIQSSSQQNPPLIKNQQNKQFLRAPPPPPPPPPPSQPPTNIPQSSPTSQQQNTYYSFKYPQNIARQYKIGKVQQFSDEEEEEEELGRIEGSGLGMPRQKRIPFLAIFTSFCIFLFGYLILVLMVLFEWL
uniref:Transmembrane protein n=1 Tax=Meloidogyne incognita TaxID=6306 RepID=A0A914M4E6_MELIC